MMQQRNERENLQLKQSGLCKAVPCSNDYMPLNL